MTLEIDMLDRLVVRTLATSISRFRTSGGGSAAGLQFEQLAFSDLVNAHEWRYATGPDQFGMGLQLASQTGTVYEFDGVFGTDTTLYVVEAKHLARGSLTREHIGIFVQKLMDTLLGSYHDLARFDIKPVVASAQPAVDAAAYRYAISWGILLVDPERLTPYELLDLAESGNLPERETRRLMSDCPSLASRLWRSFLPRADAGQLARLVVDARQVYAASQVSGILDFWRDCEQAAGHG